MLALYKHEHCSDISSVCTQEWWDVPESVDDATRLLAAIALGFHMGKTAQLLFAQKWEEGWAKPLAQWQAELNIQPVRSYAALACPI